MTYFYKRNMTGDLNPAFFGVALFACYFQFPFHFFKGWIQWLCFSLQLFY